MVISVVKYLGDVQSFPPRDRFPDTRFEEYLPQYFYNIDTFAFT